MAHKMQAVLFDMDGVLFNTERPAGDAIRDAAREMGRDVPEAVLQQLYGVNAALEKQVIMGHMGPGFDYDVFHAHLKTRYAELIDQNGLEVMPGVRGALEELKAAGYRLAVASSSSRASIQGNLAKAGLAGFFEALVGGDMVAHSKPAPDIYIAAAGALGLAPGACFAVEDSYNGVQSAHSAGCVTVMIPDIMPATDVQRRQTAAVLGSLRQLFDFVQTYESN